MMDVMNILRLFECKNKQDLKLLRYQISLLAKALTHIPIDDLVVARLLKFGKPG